MKQAWPQVRAALVLLHVIAVFALAFPAPGGGMSRAAWKDPTVQDEFSLWTERLNGLGWSGTPEQLEERLWDFSVRYMEGRDALLAPARPYYRWCGTWQSWRMFVAPHRYPAKLHVDVLRGSGWQKLYESRSREHAWHAEQFDHDRFRSALFRTSGPQYKRTYDQLVDWIAAQVRAELPDARAVRVRYYKYRTPDPEEVREGRIPAGRFQQSRTVEL